MAVYFDFILEVMTIFIPSQIVEVISQATRCSKFQLKIISRMNLCNIALVDIGPNCVPIVLQG